LNGRDLDRRRFIRIALAGIQVSVRHDYTIVYFLSRLEISIRFFGAAARRQCPDNFFGSKVCRYTKPIEPTLAPRQEIRRLPGVGTARLNVIVWAWLNDEFFLPIPVEVTEHKVESAIWISDPSFEVGNHILTRIESDLWQLRRKLRSESEQENDR
jgi:hypothetical protein